MKGEEVMVTSDALKGLAYFDVGTVVKETERAIYVRFPGRLKAIEFGKESGMYERLGRPGLEPEDEGT